MVPVIPVASVMTVVTKYVYLPLVQLTVVSGNVKLVGSGSGVPAGTGTVGLGGSRLKGPPFFER